MDFSILVNKENLLSSTFVPKDLVEIQEPTGSKLDKTYINRLNKVAYAFFKLMQQAAKKEGYEIFIDSSYRTYEYQKRVFDSCAEEKGIDEAKKRVAPPGGSEHQTGLAIDIISRRNGIMIEESSDDDPEIIWMKDNCYKYGYILRYPKGKEHITGYSYERWHYRFVGLEIALEMKEKNIETLEEYYLIKKRLLSKSEKMKEK